MRIIAIDEASLEELGQWPWPRSRLAEAIDDLASLEQPDRLRRIFNEPDGRVPRVSSSLSGECVNVCRPLGGAETNDKRLPRRSPTAGRPRRITSPAVAIRDLGSKASFAYAGDDPEPFIIEFGGIAGPLPVLLGCKRYRGCELAS